MGCQLIPVPPNQGDPAPGGRALPASPLVDGLCPRPSRRKASRGLPDTEGGGENPVAPHGHLHTAMLASTQGHPQPGSRKAPPPPHPGTWAQLPASKRTRVMQVLESVQTRTSDGHRLTKQASPRDDSVTGRGPQLQKQSVRTQLPAKMKGGQMEGSR